MIFELHENSHAKWTDLNKDISSCFDIKGPIMGLNERFANRE